MIVVNNHNPFQRDPEIKTYLTQHKAEHVAEVAVHSGQTAIEGALESTVVVARHIAGVEAVGSPDSLPLFAVEVEPVVEPQQAAVTEQQVFEALQRELFPHLAA